MPTHPRRPGRGLAEAARAAIRARRQFVGLTQEALANDADISQATVSEIERGDLDIHALSLGRVVSYARALRWTLAEMEFALGLNLNVGFAEDDTALYVTVVVPLWPSRGAPTGDTVPIVVSRHLDSSTLSAFRVWAETAHRLPAGTLIVVQAVERVRRGQVVLIETGGERHVAYAMDATAARVKVTAPLHFGGPVVFEPDKLLGRFVTVQSEDAEMDAPEGFL